MALSLLNSGKTITVRDDALEGVANGDPEVTYTVRQLDPERIRTIRKRHTKSVATRTGREDRVDFDGLIEDTVDEALIAWTGVLDDGVPAACTRENKQLLDYTRKQALISIAGSNEVQKAEDKESSFRGPAGVVPVLGRQGSV